jgi:hypothetical protein
LAEIARTGNKKYFLNPFVYRWEVLHLTANTTSLLPMVRFSQSLVHRKLVLNRPTVWTLSSQRMSTK